MMPISNKHPPRIQTSRPFDSSTLRNLTISFGLSCVCKQVSNSDMRLACSRSVFLRKTQLEQEPNGKETEELSWNWRNIVLWMTLPQERGGHWHWIDREDCIDRQGDKMDPPTSGCAI